MFGRSIRIYPGTSMFGFSELVVDACLEPVHCTGPERREVEEPAWWAVVVHSEKVPNETIAGTGCHDFAWTHRSRVRERD